jgi:SAM-dependent methyltransferase
VAESCPACGSRKGRFQFEAEDYEHGVPGIWRVSKCLDCELLFQDPMPHADRIASFYPPSYSAYNSNTVISLLFALVYWLDARRVRSLIGESGRILDVGCGNGAALLKLRSAGRWELAGLEIDTEAAAKASAAGLDARQGELVGCDFPGSSFDLIRMGHVIEHVLDPVATLRKAFELLRPGGILFGETPNADCLDYRILRQYWGALHVPRHLTFFNVRNLADALRRAGFLDVRIQPRLRTVGWSAGIQNILADKFGLTVPSTGRVSWYLLLILPFLPVTAFQALFSRTGTVAFIARKPAE